MKRFRYKLEDYGRSLVWYYDYIKFRISNPILKKPGKINKILIIDLKFIGDLIIDTPMIKNLKNNYPNSEISFLLPPGMEIVLQGNPNLKNIYTDKSQINEIFDLGILLYPGDKEYSSFLKKVAKFRIGIRRSGITEPKGYFLHRKTKPNFKLKHKVEDNLDVLKTINIKARSKYLELYSDTETKYKNYIVLTTVSNSHPTWSNEKFAELADKLAEKYNKKILFTGDKNGKDEINKTISLMKASAVNQAEDTSLMDYISAIKYAFLVVCIDTSAQHIAAAFKVPVVSLFSAGDKNIWRPYSNNSIAIQSEKVCTSCMKSTCSLKKERYLECVNSISVDYVLKQTEKLV